MSVSWQSALFSQFKCYTHWCKPPILFTYAKKDNERLNLERTPYCVNLKWELFLLILIIINKSILCLSKKGFVGLYRLSFSPPWVVVSWLSSCTKSTALVKDIEQKCWLLIYRCTGLLFDLWFSMTGLYTWPTFSPLYNCQASFWEEVWF